MNKCDFCLYYDPFNNKCGDKGSLRSCSEAIKIYTQVLINQNNNTKTKNVNINKSNNKNK